VKVLELRVTSYELRVTSYELGIMGFQFFDEPWFMAHELPLHAPPTVGTRAGRQELRRKEGKE